VLQSIEFCKLSMSSCTMSVIVFRSCLIMEYKDNVYADQCNLIERTGSAWLRLDVWKPRGIRED
jgi:hypothetical protein